MSRPAAMPRRTMPRRAMILAAGLGKRMRPITATTPKPLVRVAGRSLLDRALDRLAAAGVEDVVINVHYLADLVEQHARRRKGGPKVHISDERQKLLDTGGGIRKALPLLGEEPFFLVNSDTLWLEGPLPNLDLLADEWDAQRMDILLLMAPTATSLGYDGRGDFSMDASGRLTRRPEREVVPFAYAGVAIVKPQLFADAPEGPFSLNRIFDEVAERGRLHGARIEGQWLHVGTPEALRAAEARFATTD
ncbi:MULTISPECIES: nucleotidyltransferase family protein [Chelatococcus]|nr:MULTISPECIES: nucleotidyltransferase family protein [Chelatococcus]